MRPARAFVSLFVAATLAAGCGQDSGQISAPGQISWSPFSPTFVEGTSKVELRLLPIGGTPPYQFEATGSPPPGLVLGTDGVLRGNPDALGEFSFDVRVSDSRGLSALLATVIRINPPSNRQFPEILSKRPLTGDEMTRLIGSRELLRMRRWAHGSGYTANTSGAVYITFDRPGADMVGVPLLNRSTGKEVWGSIYLIHPFTPQEEGMSYVAYPSPTAPRLAFYGGDGSDVTHHFNTSRKSVRVSGTEGSGCGSTWEAFKRWLSSESGAEDLPWWLDLLCGLVCGDALLGTHNPWSISACLHCVAAYIAACVPVGSPTAIGADVVPVGN